MNQFVPTKDKSFLNPARYRSGSHLELERKNQELAALYEVSLAVSQTIDLDKLLAQVLETVTSLEMFRVLNKGGILLVEANGTMRLAAYTGSGHTDEFLELHSDIKVGECLCGLAAETGKIVTSEDSWHDAAHTIRYKDMTAHGHVIVPLRAIGKTVGVMYLYLPVGVRMDRRSLEVLSSIGDQVGIAIDNATAYKRELAYREQIEDYAERLSMLNDVAVAINSEIHAGRLLKGVLKGSIKLTGGDYGFLVSSARKGVKSPLYYHTESVLINPSIADHFPLESYHKRISQEGVIAISREDMVEIHGAHNSSAPDNFLISGICDDERKLTWYLILGKSTEYFSEDDKRLISLLTVQAAAALINVRNYEKEHMIAEKLQSVLLTDAPSRDGIDIGLIYFSADKVGRIGGDFYDFVELDDGRLAISIGDVSGKGLDRAEYSAMIRFMLKAYLHDGKDPGDCLTSLSKALFNELHEDMFVTACIIIFDKENDEITYSSAGHYMPIACQSCGVSYSLNTADPAVPLGIYPEFRYKSTAKSLSDICGIIMYTDGEVEARDADGNLFGQDGIIRLIPELEHLPPQRIAEKIYLAALRHAGGQLSDDIALIVIKLIDKN